MTRWGHDGKSRTKIDKERCQEQPWMKDHTEKEAQGPGEEGTKRRSRAEP